MNDVLVVFLAAGAAFGLLAYSRRAGEGAARYRETAYGGGNVGGDVLEASNFSNQVQTWQV